jgi:8-oxo-dGTP diphosphatase
VGGVLDPAAKFATPRIAAGALFAHRDRVLLVRTTYGKRWNIPGGYADAGESPAAACRRELREELGLEREPRRLLVVDWAPNADDGDRMFCIFGCGSPGHDEHLQIASDELDRLEWVPVGQLDSYVTTRLALRVHAAYRAHLTTTSQYLEHGRPAQWDPHGYQFPVAGTGM